MSDKKKEPELKACPFCGCDAGIGTVIYDQESDTAKLNGQRKFWYVNCIACGANNRGLVGFQSEAEAIEAWNRRQPDSRVEEKKCENCYGYESCLQTPKVLCELFAWTQQGFSDAKLAYPDTTKRKEEENE